jgi:hypothetical protein
MKISPISTISFLLSALSPFILSGAAHAITVEGDAVTASGRPLAYATLYFPVQSASEASVAPSGIRSETVTDAKGHFVWSGPPPEAFNPSIAYPHCYALTADRSVADMAALNGDGALTADLTSSILRREGRECEIRWDHIAPGSQISVVVPDFGDAVLTLRADDGRLVTNKDVQVESIASYTDGAVIYKAHADAQGRVRTRWFAGLRRLAVFAPGIGFGSTGIFETPAGKSVNVPMPALVPFATVFGVVAPALRKPGAVVRFVGSQGDFAYWRPCSAPVNADGSFTVRDALPDGLQCELIGGKAAAKYTPITLQPGEHRREVVLHKDLSAPQRFSMLDFPLNRITLEGMVTTPSGSPVAGAEVFAIYPSRNIFPQSSETKTAKTDATGHYSIAWETRNTPRPRLQRVYASVPGFPVAQVEVNSSWSSSPSPQNTEAKDENVDLVIPAFHPGLTVQALRDGAPCAGAVVHLWPDWNMFYGGVCPVDPDSPSATKPLLPLERTTGDDGKAHFPNLTPGPWRIDASIYGDFKDAINAKFADSAQAIVDPAGETNVSLHLQYRDIQLRDNNLLARALGTFPAGARLSEKWEQPVTHVLTDGYDSMDSEGLFHIRTGGTGLWLLHLRVQGGGENPFQSKTGAHSDGSLLIAASAAMQRVTTPVVRMTKHRLGSVCVTLTDAAGKPQFGCIFLRLLGSLENMSCWGATDESGRVVFRGLLSGQYAVRAIPKGVLPPDLGADQDPFPPDTSLRGLSLFASQSVEVREDYDTPVKMSSQRMGYVRGAIVLPAPDASSNYRAGDFPGFWGAIFRFNPKTGEFLGGPLPGNVKDLELWPVSPSLKARRAVLTVHPGDVAHQAISKLTPAPPERENSYGALLQEKVSGRLMMPDGVTPAWGARAALVSTDVTISSLRLQIDALGRMRSMKTWDDCLSSAYETPHAPVETFIAAWLPGRSGVVIAPYVKGQDFHLVLPEAVEIHGRVTLMGKAPSAQSSRFQVKAAYQRRGRLGQLSDVETVAEFDGSFMLPGLTPGTYQIQAARDGVWLSQSQMLVVGNGEEPNLKFDIPAAGAPIVLKFVGAAGAPLPNQSVELRRPQGPLSDALWPKSLTADSAGMLRLEGLEAGRQTVIIPANSPNSKPQEISFDVPPAGAPDKEILLRVKR